MRTGRGFQNDCVITIGWWNVLVMNELIFNGTPAQTIKSAIGCQTNGNLKANECNGKQYIC